MKVFPNYKIERCASNTKNSLFGGVTEGGDQLMPLPIGHFRKYHNIPCLSPQILHKHCFQFLLGLTMVPRENKNNTYANFGGTNNDYYGIVPSDLLRMSLKQSSKLSQTGHNREDLLRSDCQQMFEETYFHTLLLV